MCCFAVTPLILLSPPDTMLLMENISPVDLENLLCLQAYLPVHLGFYTSHFLKDFCCKGSDILKNTLLRVHTQETLHSWTMWMGLREDVDANAFSRVDGLS